MKKKRVLSLLLASAMIASLAAGCGSGGGGSDNGEEKVTLTILAGQSTTDAGNIRKLPWNGNVWTGAMTSSRRCSSICSQDSRTL